MVINLFNNLLGLVNTSLFGALPERPSDDELDLYRTRLLSEFNGTVTRAAHGLADGIITPDEFEIVMKAEIKSNETGLAVIGAGGAHLADANTRLIAQDAVDRQMTYFDAWMADIRVGNIGSPQYMANRARMYGTSAGQTFERSMVQALGCPTMPFYPKNQVICKMGCCCSWDIRPLRGNGNFDCYWTLDPECDHCATCLAREAVANPLRVRNGVIMDTEKYQAGSLYA